MLSSVFHTTATMCSSPTRMGPVLMLDTCTRPHSATATRAVAVGAGAVLVLGTCKARLGLGLGLALGLGLGLSISQITDCKVAGNIHLMRPAWAKVTMRVCYDGGSYDSFGQGYNEGML